jgi:hypothetical protein
MDADLDTLLISLYASVDDTLKAHPDVCPSRREGTFTTATSDAEIICLMVLAQLLGFTNERRWVRWFKTHLASWFPVTPSQPGYNKRVRALVGVLSWTQDWFARQTSQWFDDVWLADSTPVECARSHESVHRSELAGYASYGYCASHTRWFWGFRLHLVATLGGLPIRWALTPANTSERETLLDMLDETGLDLPGHTIIADKGYAGRDLEATLNRGGITLLRPAKKGEPDRPGSALFKPFRQVIESINATLKTHLDIEHHRGRTPAGVCARIGAAILALTVVIWHNENIGAPIPRSLTAYDH